MGQRVIGRPRRRHLRCLGLVVGIGNLRHCLDHPNDRFRAVAVHHGNGILGTLVVNGLRALVVHRRPRWVAYADVKDVAGLDCDALRALVEGRVAVVAVQEGLNHVVLVDRGGRHGDPRTVPGNAQGILQGIAVKTGGEGPAANVQVLQTSVRIAPETPHIFAQVLGEHDVQVVAVCQLVGAAASDPEGLETFVDKPVVEGAHPAGTPGTVELGQAGLAVVPPAISIFIHIDAGQVGDIIASGIAGPGTPPGVAVQGQGLEYDGHHGVLGAQVIPARRQGAGEVSAPVGVILNADIHLAYHGAKVRDLRATLEGGADAVARIHIVEGIGSAAVRTDVQLVQIDRLSVYAQSGDLVTVVRRDVEDLIFAGIHFDRAKRINISIAASRRRDGKGLRCGLCQDDEGAQVVHADADHPATVRNAACAGKNLMATVIADNQHFVLSTQGKAVVHGDGEGKVVTTERGKFCAAHPDRHFHRHATGEVRPIGNYVLHCAVTLLLHMDGQLLPVSLFLGNGAQDICGEGDGSPGRLDLHTGIGLRDGLGRARGQFHADRGNAAAVRRGNDGDGIRR